MTDYVIFAGTANPDLAAAVAAQLNIGLGRCRVQQFPDGELSVNLLDPVRRREVFLVQPTSPPVNEHLMELLVFADACRRASAERITAVVPYFGYARADRRLGLHQSITARMVSDLLESVGIHHVITFNLHTAQMEGFFRVPVDNLSAVDPLFNAVRNKVHPETLVVAPDAGAVRMASEYARRFGTSVVVLHKQRDTATQTRVTHVVGAVKNRSCLVVDDMISTGGTILEAVEALLAAGARPDIVVAATHGLLLKGASQNLSHSAIREVLVTDTVHIPHAQLHRVQVVSVAPLLASAIRSLIETG